MRELSRCAQGLKIVLFFVGQHGECRLPWCSVAAGTVRHLAKAHWWLGTFLRSEVLHHAWV